MINKTNRNIVNNAENMGGIYVHIPYCRQKCSYCNFVSFSDLSSQKQYIERLKEEMERRASSFGLECLGGLGTSQFNTIYIGGGTPSVLSAGTIKEIRDSLYRNYQFSRELEFSVEANPESCNESFLSDCINAGVNRLSLGLQSCNDEILIGAGRLHSFKDFLSAYKKARDFGFKNISADLIIGLKGETKTTFSDSIDRILELELKHISLYSLKTEAGTRLHASGYEPDDDVMRDLYEMANERLSALGYLRYEVSNFAKPSFESRHNIKYWTLSPYLGFGVSAHSYFPVKNSKFRAANTDDISKYLGGQYVDSVLDVTEEEREEFIMLGLRMSEGISIKEYETRFGESLVEAKKAEIARLNSRDRVILIEGDRLKIAKEYAYVMNSIILALI